MKMAGACVLVLFAALLFASSFAQVTVTDLTSGTLVDGTLRVTTQEEALNLVYYRIWVPSNASTVTLDYVDKQSDSSCPPLSFFQRAGALPCSTEFSAGITAVLLCVSFARKRWKRVGCVSVFVSVVGSGIFVFSLVFSFPCIFLLAMVVLSLSLRFLDSVRALACHR